MPTAWSSFHDCELLLGRSARNDLCVEDPFASRLHAEVRRRGDRYWLSDLGSANGTLLNGSRLLTAAQLQDGDQVRIGETEIEYSERADTAPARNRTSVLVSDAFQPPAPEVMIDAESQAPASKLLSVIDTSSKTQIGTIIGRADLLPDQSLAIISRVSLTLLSQLSLNDTLIHVLDSVFQAVPADRGYIMLSSRPKSSLPRRTRRPRRSSSSSARP